MCESGDWFLLHDNAPTHNATIVKQYLAQRKVTVLDKPPYSPDLAPADYFLFQKVISHLKGRLFDSISYTQKLYDRANLCVQLEGMYVEN
jgi:transposase